MKWPETSLIDCSLSCQQKATTKILLRTIVWLLWRDAYWREVYFVKWPHNPRRKKRQTSLYSMGVLPAIINFRIFTLKNTIFTLNLHTFSWSSFFSLHRWKIWRNLPSSFLHFAKTFVFTFFTLKKPKSSVFQKTRLGPHSIYACRPWCSSLFHSLRGVFLPSYDVGVCRAVWMITRSSRGSCKMFVDLLKVL